MWDFHTHILPGIDDGAEDMEEAISMIEQLKGLGFEGVVATPHANPMYIPARKRLEELRNEIREKTQFPILIGYEVAMDTFMVHDANSLTIEGTNMILVELPWSDENFDYTSVLISLLKKGLKPILAHPERHFYINERKLESIRATGTLIQVNVKSLVGGYGEEIRKRALKFFPVADLVGSDAHSPEDYRLFISKGANYYEGRDFKKYKEQEF